MVSKITLNTPINRVEGDLEVRTDVEGGRCTDAWCSGTMFRGFEQILQGRGPLDGLVITPRICGICGTAHLTAAAMALEALSGCVPPPKAVALRNVALMTEHVQSDLRQSALTFAADLINPAFRAQPLFEEAKRRYAPFAGRTALEAVRESRELLEIVAIIGGQWPHSTFIVPGGITSLPSCSDLAQCQLLLDGTRRWYEERVLGCTLERWQALRTAADLDAWLEEKESHRDGEVGFVLRYGRAIGLDRLGAGHGRFLSVGSLPLPEGTAVRGRRPGPRLIAAGLARVTARDGAGVKVDPFDPERIAEHTACSWYQGGDGGQHPREGTTVPYATGREGRAYSWAKAPRYDGLPAETGPLAEALVDGNPLLTDLVARRGPSVLLRQLARLVRPAELFAPMQQWLREAQTPERGYLPPEKKLEQGEGCGLLHAARGALGHWVRLRDGAIEHYQVIAPTTWNASPRDAAGARGPIEEALVGTPVADAADPVELGLVVRSFDPCLVCTVH